MVTYLETESDSFLFVQFDVTFSKNIPDQDFLTDCLLPKFYPQLDTILELIRHHHLHRNLE